jgi:hypothetical protein
MRQPTTPITAALFILLTALAVALACGSAPGPASADAPPAVLQVLANGSGTVTVEGPRAESPPGCPLTDFYPGTGRCEYKSFLQGETVKLTATPAAADGATFQGWSDDRCPAGATCTLTLAEAQTVVALFSPLEVTVSANGAGDGAVTISDGDGHTCTPLSAGLPTNTRCMFKLGAQLTLVATGTDPRWNGEDCDSFVAGTCKVTLLGDQQAHVGFGEDARPDAPPRTEVIFRVRKTGDGSGTVRGALDCGSTCSVRKLFRDPVTIVAEAAPGSRFVRWNGGCGTNPSCALQATGTSVTAEFAALPQAPPPAGPSHQRFAAAVGRITATGRRRARQIRIPVAVNAPAAASATLARGRRRVLTTSFAVAPGKRVLRLRVPRSARAGRYRVTVTISDRAGSPPVRVARNVRVPR